MAESLAMARGRELNAQVAGVGAWRGSRGSEKRGLGPGMCLRWSSRASRPKAKSGPHGGRCAEAGAGVLCLSPLPSSAHAAHERLGTGGGRSRQAERMLCLAGASWSYAKASQYLSELSGLRVAANTVRSVCHCESRTIEAWQANDPRACEKYRKTPGQDEFETDGTCVNTTTGWKEMRVGVFARRVSGAPASAAEWSTRKLPWPGARVAFAAIEDHETFAARWPRVGSRLGIRAGAALNVLADGARWIWERVDYHFAFAQGTLDIFHAVEHVGQTAKALFGEGTPATERWRDQARDALLSDGWNGIQRVIDQRADCGSCQSACVVG